MTDRWESIWHYPLVELTGGGVITFSQVVMAVLLVLVGYLTSRILERQVRLRLSKTGLRPDAIHALQRILFFVMLAVVILTSLSILRIPLTTFAFVTSAVAIGVGFGAQNIINNFISGWILMSEKPVRIDDFVEVDGAQGVVEMIGTRSTRIRRTDGVHMLVPNSLMLERTVINWTLVDYEVRTTVRVGVAYGSPARKVAELIRSCLDAHDQIIQYPAPMVILEDFGDNALIFDAYFWCNVKTHAALRQIRSDIRFAIDDRFRENGIVIAFPQRDVHLDAQRPLEVRVVKKDSRKKTE